MSDGFKDSTVAFLYASQTGNAESICYKIYEEAVSRGFQATYHVLDDYRKFNFDSLRTAVFVVSTTGDGDPPDNSARFWRVLRRTSKDPKAYGHLRYTVLGLGDTNYSNFCNTAVRLDKQLREAGAQTFYPRALADDATGLEDVVEPWIDGLWAPLAKVAVCGSGENTREASVAVEDAEQAARLVVDESSDVDGIADAVGAMSLAAVHQPLVLDFRAMAGLQKLTGTPRLPAAICSAVPSEKASADRDADLSTCPPWHEALVSEHEGDSALRPFVATITGYRQLTSADAVKRTLLLDIRLPESERTDVCVAGDSFNVFAPNDASLVSALLRRLDVSGDDLVALKSLDDRVELPVHLQRFQKGRYTVRDILTWSADLASAPKKHTLRALAECCTDTRDRERLLFLASRQGSAVFDELRRQAPNIVDLLHAFASCKPSIARLIELLPSLAPRAYSICNAPGNGLWRIAFNVVEYALEASDPFSASEDQRVSIERRGLCTPWLEMLARGNSGAHILVARRSGHFRLPPATTQPIIMVGPGTGVAPFIGFLEQRAVEDSSAIGSAWLFFGCRSPTRDHLFRAELDKWIDSAVLSRLSLCFSRDAAARDAADADVYVQDALKRHWEEVAELVVEKKALVFVCGDAKGMGRDVNEALADILCRYAAKHPDALPKLGVEPTKNDLDDQQEAMTKVQALQVLMRLASEKRYLRDLWA
ncbi:hypothetical protein LPJ64_001334 [Coemansia asiatica]|uniref:Methionine synthase reductase n=1 Tax=Coemansia asiatica TaxID=1052880 RepID=A0A9W7XQ56_9FUNG|nr:hypothetical protein LPJ64_001334 [Coemansia asiatica]KAJ2884940.1 hypothetical protein FB639_001868 [Coemansia asiatica]